MRSSSEEAFLRHLEPCKAILYKVAYTYCRDAEERRDLVQEMVMQCWRSFPRFDEAAGVKFSTWMYRVAMNVAISRFRTEKREVRDTVPLDEFALDLAAADQLDEKQSDNLRVLRQLIDGMDELNRALVLLFLEGFDSDEIAAMVGISASNVSTRMSRIKQKLTEQFSAAVSEGEAR